MNTIGLPTYNVFYKGATWKNQLYNLDNINRNYRSVLYDHEGLFNWDTTTYVVPQSGIYSVSGQIIKYTVTSNTQGPYAITIPSNTIIK